MAFPTLLWRRVALLLAVLIVVVGAVAGLHRYRQIEQAEVIAGHRERAMAAVAAGEAHAALEHFGEYLTHEPNDAGAIYQQAQMTLAAEPTEPEAVRLAAGRLLRVLELEPTHPTAERELLELYRQLGEHDEVRRLAAAMVRDDADDLDAARAYAVALARLGREREALRAAEAFLRHYGDDWRLHLIAIELRVRRGDAAGEAVAEAQALHDRHEGDVRYALLLARALRLGGRDDEARQWMARVANERPPVAMFARLVVATLDDMGEYAAGRAYLAAWAGGLRDRPLGRELAWRLFEAGRFDELAMWLAERDAAAGDWQLDADELALWALAAHERGEAAQARALAERLAGRERDRRARAWVTVFQAGQPGDANGLGEVVASLTEAIEITAHQPFFYALLAEAYATGDEHELALQLWQHIAEARPSWSTPLVREAEQRLAMGQPARAMEAAQQALRRQPGSVAAAATLARAWAASLQAGQHGGDEGLFDLIDQVQAALPGERTTAMLRVERLAALGRGDEAQAVALALLDEPRFVSDGEALLALAAVAREHGWGVHEDVLQTYERQHGSTAGLALARALAEPAGESSMTSTSTRTSGDGGGDDALDWGRARARYLEAVGDARAGEAWAALAEAHPADVGVQLEALQCDGVWAHRDVVARAVDRLRGAMGESSLNWRVARARWLLEAEDAARHTGAAVRLLEHVKEAAPHRIEPRLLLAEAQRLAGRPALALDELRAVAERSPDAVALRLSMAELQFEQGQHASARRAAQSVVDHDQASSAERERARQIITDIEQAAREASAVGPDDTAR